MTVEGFDDGRPDVPVGVAGPVERVVVVGAGIAGLTVANALAHGGVECVVVEARDRIGGRLRTVDLAGSPVDLGASWIHTPWGTLCAHSRHAGVPCRSANPLPELAGFDCGEQRRLSAGEVEASLSMQLASFPGAMGRLLADLGAEASAADGIEAFVAGASLAPGPARRARQALRALIGLLEPSRKGQLTQSPVEIGEPRVAVGWRLANDGRTVMVDSALGGHSDSTSRDREGA